MAIDEYGVYRNINVVVWYCFINGISKRGNISDSWQFEVCCLWLFTFFRSLIIWLPAESYGSRL